MSRDDVSRKKIGELHSEDYKKAGWGVGIMGFRRPYIFTDYDCIRILIGELLRLRFLHRP